MLKLIIDYIRYDIPYGIRNLISWFPTVWKQRDYDYSYIYDVLRFKLEKTYKCISENSYEVEEDKAIRLRDIRLCINLIEKINSGFYESEYYDYYESEFNFVDLNDGSNCSRMDVIYGSDHLIDYINQHRSRLLTIKDYSLETIEDRISVSLKISRLNHEKAVKLLFHVLQTKLEGFWY